MSREKAAPGRVLGKDIACGAHEALPEADVIRSARVLLVDHLGIPGMLRAAQIAREAGVAVVSDLERDEAPGFQALFDLMGHLVIGEGFALRRSGAKSAVDAARALWSPMRAAVVVTRGELGCVFTTDGATMREVPALRVQVVDTTGCGDVFHGAYCAMLARGAAIAECVRVASVAASLKATCSRLYTITTLLKSWSDSGYVIPRLLSASTITLLMTQSRYHFLLAGTMCQGA
jgi:sulfofructose kinase